MKITIEQSIIAFYYSAQAELFELYEVQIEYVQWFDEMQRLYKGLGI